jgi:MEMO1 family protein
MDPNALRTGMDTFFHQPPTLSQQEQAKYSQTLPPPNKRTKDNLVLAIISPHARFDASGPVSAQAFKAVGTQCVKRVFILAPRHTIAFRGAALPKCLSFQTPLGNLKVDSKAVSNLKHNRFFFCDDNLFACDDHAIELQLPFIRYKFGDIPIVPIMIGDLRNTREIKLVAQTLKAQLTPEDLLIISMDFTHYGPKYNFCPYKDNIMNKIRELDFKAYEYIAKDDLNGFMNFKHKTGAPLCGFTPCCILLAMLPKPTTAYLLDYDTCDHTLGTLKQKGFSVSYMAVVFTGGTWQSQPHKQATPPTT